MVITSWSAIKCTGAGLRLCGEWVVFCLYEKNIINNYYSIGIEPSFELMMWTLEFIYYFNSHYIHNIYVCVCVYSFSNPCLIKNDRQGISIKFLINFSSMQAGIFFLLDLENC